MAASLVPLLNHLRRLSAAEPDSNAARLDRFARLGDQRAFAALVDEHGPMVLRVCRRVLGDAQAAEDATQATFLVLARKAGAVGRAEALAGWLHGVARRVAFKARAGLARRGLPLLATETPADMHPDPLAELSIRELLAIIDEEVERLPSDYRLPVLLCCLEGKSQEEVARQLGWTAGSVKGRQREECLPPRLPPPESDCTDPTVAGRGRGSVGRPMKKIRIVRMNLKHGLAVGQTGVGQKFLAFQVRAR